MRLENAAGSELDCWVAKAEGKRLEKRIVVGEDGIEPVPPYSTDAKLARVIMEREGIRTSWVVDGDWEPAEHAIAWIDRPAGPKGEPAVKTGIWMAESEIAAAMLCFVFLRLGDVWQKN
jgi:hypothetical protein